MLIIPAIDLRGGVCVRLLQGRFDAVTTYDDDPAARMAAFADAAAEWVHIVDLDGAEAGAARQHALIGRLARDSGLKVQAGGGVRAVEDVERLLEAGVERVVVGSLAVRQPETVVGWLERFGPERLVLALDVRVDAGEPEVATHGWTQGSGVSLWAALERLAGGEPQQLLVTDVAKDGALAGPNLELMRKVVSRSPELALQASGGVSGLEDIRALAATGAAAVIVGRALYEGRFTLKEALGAG